MASVVFFRAANVGGYQTFQPGVLAKSLTGFGVVNIGAAGTFVVRKHVSPAKLREEILRRLPFQPELMICPAQEVLELSRSPLFQEAPTGKDITRYVSVLRKAPRPLPSLPLEQPAGAKWEVRIVEVCNRFAMSFQRPGKTRAYPNAVVEKHFDIPATTRNWNTITAIAKILKPDEDGGSLAVAAGGST